MTISSATEERCKHPGEDKCDWRFDAGDSSTGIPMLWVCDVCDAIDVNREPPSYDDDVI